MIKGAFLSGILLIVANACLAQRTNRYYFWPYNDSTGKIAFTANVSVANVSRNNLFESAVDFVESFVKSDSTAVIIIDPAVNTIIAKSRFPILVNALGEKGKGYITYSLVLVCGQYHYIYTITDLEHKGSTGECATGGPLELEKPICPGVLFPRKYWLEQKEECYFQVETMIAKLMEGIGRPAVAKMQ